MSKAEVLRALVKQRLNAAAEEIFALFEKTMEEYEQEIRLHRSRQPDGHAAKSRGGPHGALPETDGRLSPLMWLLLLSSSSSSPLLLLLIMTIMNE